MHFKDKAAFDAWLDKAYRDGASTEDIIKKLDEWRRENTASVPDYVLTFIQKYSNNTKEHKPFLVIQLDSLDSVPYVFLEGKEITGRVKVEFKWETNDPFWPKKVPFINIEYMSEDIKSAGLFGTKTIRYGREDDRKEKIRSHERFDGGKRYERTKKKIYR